MEFSHPKVLDLQKLQNCNMTTMVEENFAYSCRETHMNNSILILLIFTKVEKIVIISQRF